MGPFLRRLQEERSPTHSRTKQKAMFLKTLSIMFRLILKHLHNPSTDQSLNAWKYSPDDECRITVTPYITRQVVGYRRITFLEPLRMHARRNFTHETDQAKVVLSSGLSDIETPCPHLIAAAAAGQTWKGLYSPELGHGAVLPVRHRPGSGLKYPMLIWAEHLSQGAPRSTLYGPYLGHCADWSACYNSSGN